MPVAIRMTWTAGDSNVEVGFFAKGADKCQVPISGTKRKEVCLLGSLENQVRQNSHRFGAPLPLSSIQSISTDCSCAGT